MLDKPFGRRSLLRGAGALSAVALAPWSAGCAPDDDALTFFFAANPDEREARMRIIDEFARRHPDIKVRAVLSGPGVMQQLSTFCVGGKCPDVLMTWELSYAELADRGVLLDLNPLLARDKAFAQQLKADSIPALYETFAFNGSQFALPEQWSGNYLFYNKRLFADAGVPAPPTTWQRPWDFSGFLDTARALTKRDTSGRAAQYGFVNTWVSTYSAGLFAMNNGVPWSNPRLNPTHLNFDDAAFQEAVQFYADLANEHRVAPNASETQSMSTPTCSRWGGRRSRWAGTGATRPTFAPRTSISMSRRCRSARRSPTGVRRVRTSAPPGWASRRPVHARSRPGSS